jgi:hypothetical protein
VPRAIAALDCRNPNGNWLTYGIYRTKRGALLAYNQQLRNQTNSEPGVLHGNCPGDVPSQESWEKGGYVACWLGGDSKQPNILSVRTRSKTLVWASRTPAGASMAELWAYYYNYGLTR